MREFCFLHWLPWWSVLMAVYPSFQTAADAWEGIQGIIGMTFQEVLSFGLCLNVASPRGSERVSARDDVGVSLPSLGFVRGQEDPNVVSRMLRSLMAAWKRFGM